MKLFELVKQILQHSLKVRFSLHRLLRLTLRVRHFKELVPLDSLIASLD